MSALAVTVARSAQHQEHGHSPGHVALFVSGHSFTTGDCFSEVLLNTIGQGRSTRHVALFVAGPSSSRRAGDRFSEVLFNTIGQTRFRFVTGTAWDGLAGTHKAATGTAANATVVITTLQFRDVVAQTDTVSRRKEEKGCVNTTVVITT